MAGTMEGKKISFGFMKTKKAEKPVVEEKKDYIDCLEEKSIKVVGGEAVEEEKPLVIPMKPNTLITTERLRDIAAKVESSLDEPEPEKITEVKLKPTENETLDQMAVRELLEEAKKDVKVETTVMTVPIPAKPVIDGQKESTLDDYETVPIQDFGLAMLRGMGWTPGNEQAKHKQPELRPKGLGLGADKVIKENQKKKSEKNSKQEDLSIVKNSFVKMTTGKYSGYYGKVISLDEDNGRVMVDITVKKETISLSEFMMQPVTKAEFDRESKVINTDAYEEYKKTERSQKPVKTESTKINDKEATSSHRSKDRRDTKEESRSRDHDRSSNGARENSRNQRSGRERSASEDKSSRRKKDKHKRNSSSSEEKDSRRKKDKYKRDSSSSEDRSSRRKKDKYKRDSSSSVDRDSRKKKEKYRRDSNEDRSKRKKDKKIYSSNESLSSISDAEKRKKEKNKKLYSSDSDSDVKVPKKDKKDIDKKRKGKKKKRDRDRSPHYKKHRK